MEMFESFGWVVLGGIPTLGTMEFAYRMGKKAKTSQGKKAILPLTTAKLMYLSTMIVLLAGMAALLAFTHLGPGDYSVYTSTSGSESSVLSTEVGQIIVVLGILCAIFGVIVAGVLARKTVEPTQISRPVR
jgi:hypothetical protein